MKSIMSEREALEAVRHAALINEGAQALEKNRGDIHVAVRNGLTQYLTERIEPGSFLRALLENDCMEAVRHVDPWTTVRELKTIQSVITGTFPSAAWGSKETVEAWLANKAEPIFDRFALEAISQIAAHPADDPSDHGQQLLRIRLIADKALTEKSDIDGLHVPDGGTDR